MYWPDEDSFLLEKHARNLAYGRVLDMGTGTGILAKTAMEGTNEVVAVDIDDEAVSFLKKSSQKIKVIKSDLFSNVKGKFDVIMFNPPYLPSSKYNDIALDGGKKGYEIIERFLKQSGGYLKNDGIILLLYSSYSKPRKIKQIIRENGFQEEILEEKKLSFEKLYTVKIKRKDFYTLRKS